MYEEIIADIFGTQSVSNYLIGYYLKILGIQTTAPISKIEELYDLIKEYINSHKDWHVEQLCFLFSLSEAAEKYMAKKECIIAN